MVIPTATKGHPVFKATIEYLVPRGEFDRDDFDIDAMTETKLDGMSPYRVVEIAEYDCGAFFYVNGDVREQSDVDADTHLVSYKIEKVL